MIEIIVIIDYGAGNLQSVKNALDSLGVQSRITQDPKEIESAERIILPGVGSFGYLMTQLREDGLERPIKEALKKGIPFLGICLGLQVLFEESEESPGVKGLCIFKGKVKCFKEGKIPQIGWNTVKPVKKGIFKEGDAYFVNSYYVTPEDKKIIAATTEYFQEFTSAVQKRNLIAVQFHPEKSGRFGINFLRRWLEC